MREKYFQILLLVPRAWISLINQAAEKKGMERNEWIRTILRDALIEEGAWVAKEV